MITADTRQLTALAADLARAGVTVQRPVNEELKEAAKAIRGRGRELVRKRSGRTARSITYSSKAKGLHYEIGPKWFVGRFLEFGTVNMPAYPFMQPAADRHLAGVPDRIAEAAADAMLTGRSSFIPTSLI